MCKRIIAVLLAAVMAVALTACSSEGGEETPSFFDEFPTGEEIITIEIEQNPQATLTLSDGSELLIELDYAAAPNAVQNFIALANEGIYNGMAFTDVRNDCIVMTGNADKSDYEPPYFVMDETENNSLSHKRGVVSMIKTTSKNTLTGQFFILTEDQTHFDSRFTAFGRVLVGMDVIDMIASSNVDSDNKLYDPVVISSVAVETFGEDFPNPTIIPISENKEDA